MHAQQPVVLDKPGISLVLTRLARLQQSGARDLYMRLMSCWGSRPDRQRVTIKVNESDWELLKTLKLPAGTLGLDVLESGWLVTYQHPRKPKMKVVLQTPTKPAKRRTFLLGGGTHRLVAVEVSRIGKTTKEKAIMARKAAAKKKVEEEDEDIDELEGLEDLDDLEDEDLEDEEEPEDEDDEEEEEAPAPKRRAKKAPAKPAAKKAPAKRKKAAPVEEDEDDEDEEEDEEPAPRRKKAASKAPAKKAASKGNANLPTTRELPKGQIGPQELAELVGGECDARYVRIWLRDSEYEREEGSRWAFTKTEGRTIAKEIKASRKAAGV